MRTRLSLLLALLPAVALFCFLAGKLEFLCDDAFISFRYARNFAAGEGLRYNLTLGEPVEGYSNFLWVVWLSLFERAGLDVPLWARLSSAASGLVLVVLVATHARLRLQLDLFGTAATALFAASLPPMAVWATGGLATMPTALFVFGLYLALLGDPDRPRGIAGGTLALLAVLVRADGIVWVGMVLLAALLTWLAGGRPRALLRAISWTAAIVVIGVGAHVAWRYGYYGDFLPNTARVKAAFSVHRLERGLDYVVAWLLTVPTVAFVALVSVRGWLPERRSIWLTAGIVLTGTLAYGTWVGGDFMPMGRFLFPAVPFVPLLFAAAGKSFTPEHQLFTPAVLGASVVCIAANVFGCFDLNPVPEAIRSRFHFRQDRKWESELSMRAAMYERAKEWSLVGRAMAEVVKPGETLATGAIGAIGYYTDLEIYDTYGLVTPSVIPAAPPREHSSPGHDVRVGDLFFLDRHPTYYGGRILPTDEGMPEGWEHYPAAKLVTVERHPLPDGEGFPEGKDLRLLRFHRWE